MSDSRKNNGSKRQIKGKNRKKDPPKTAGPWGRSASLYRPGLFIKQYFETHGETCCADIFRALSDHIERLNIERIQIGERPLRRPNYSSFARYFHWFLIMRLIERTDKQEPAIYDFLKRRVFYRLTEKGKNEKQAWENPVLAARNNSNKRQL
jgi:hypothetical protein